MWLCACACMRVCVWGRVKLLFNQCMHILKINMCIYWLEYLKYLTLLKIETEFINKKYPNIFQKEYVQNQKNYYTWKKAHSEYFFHTASDLGLFWQYFAYNWKSAFCDKSEFKSITNVWPCTFLIKKGWATMSAPKHYRECSLKGCHIGSGSGTLFVVQEQHAYQTR